MCNLYSHTRNVEAMRRLFATFDVAAQIVPQPGIFPDYAAPIIRNEGGNPTLAMTRWGMPSPAFALEGKKTDPGVTNVRNTKSPHWRRWLGVENRCLVPFTAFSEFNRAEGGDIWFAFGEDRPTAFFAGLWTPQWTSVRKLKEGPVSADLYAFLTTDPNAEVKAIHPKAMPVILTTPEACETWMTAPWERASVLQRSLPDGALRIVARGVKQDGGGG
jgi:putative SOS response-associated peptidase YedK